MVDWRIMKRTLIVSLSAFALLLWGCDDSPESNGGSAGESAGEAAGESAGETAGETAGGTAGESAGETAGESAGETAGESAGETAGQEPIDPSAVAYLKVEPPSLFFKSEGETATLSVTAYNGLDEALEGRSVTWSADDQSVVTLSADGAASAQEVGSTQLFAEVDGVRSPPVLVFNTRLKEDVVLFEMDSIELSRIRRVDDGEDEVGALIEIGWVGDAPPAEGSVLLPSDDEMIDAYPIYGRVESSRADGDVNLLTLSPIDYTDVFAEIEIDEQIDLNSFPIEQTSEEKNVAGCESDAGANINVRFDPTFDLVQRPRLHLSANAERFRFAYEGDLVAQIGVNEFGLSAGIEASFQCKLRLVSLNIPISGLLAALFQLRVDLGAALEVKADVSAAITFSSLGEVRSEVELGVECEAMGGCQGLDEISFSAEGFEPQWTNEGDTRFKGTLQLGAYLDGIATSPTMKFISFVRSLSGGEAVPDDVGEIPLVKGFAGLETSVEIGSVADQLTDPGFANGITLDAIAKVELKVPDLELKPLFKVSIPSISAEIDPISLFSTPRGAVYVSPETDFEVGDELTFTFTLDSPDTGLFGAPEEVKYYIIRDQSVELIGSAPFGEGFVWEATEEAVNGVDGRPLKIGSTYTHPLDFNRGFETSLDSTITLSPDPQGCEYTPELVITTDAYFTFLGSDPDINARGEVAFSAGTSVGERGEGVWFVNPQGEVTLLSFEIDESTNRSYRGSAITNADPAQILTRDQSPGPASRLRLWGTDGSMNVLGQSDDDFGAASRWADANSQGVVVHFATSRFSDSHCRNLHMFDALGNQVFLEYIDCGGNPRIRPQINEVGEIVYRDVNNSLVMREIMGAPRSLAGSCSNIGDMPGISPEGDFVGFFGTCGSYGPHLLPTAGGQAIPLFETPWPVESVDGGGRVAIATHSRACQGGPEGSRGVSIGYLAPATGEQPEGVDIVDLVIDAEGVSAMQVVHRLVSVGDQIESHNVSSITAPTHLMSTNGHAVVKVGFEDGSSGIVRYLRE